MSSIKTESCKYTKVLDHVLDKNNKKKLGFVETNRKRNARKQEVTYYLIEKFYKKSIQAGRHLAKTFKT